MKEWISEWGVYPCNVGMALAEMERTGFMLYGISPCYGEEETLFMIVAYKGSTPQEAMESQK